MSDLTFENCFTASSCPVCGSLANNMGYPIDVNYIVNHTGVDLSEEKIGVTVCLSCSHQFIQPVPTSKFLGAFYSSYMSAAKNGFYQARKEKEISEQFSCYYAPWVAKIKVLLEGKLKPKLLDVGCGLGMFLRLARDYGCAVKGIEPNTEAVEALEKNYAITAYNCFLEEYSGDETFDVITMWDLLEHLAHPKTAIEKIHCILNPEGLLVLEIPIRDSLLHWTAKCLYRISFGMIKRPLFLIYGVHHLQYFSQQSIVEFIEENSFKVIEHTRAETSLDALRKTEGDLKSYLYNFSLTLMFSFARLMGKKNKLVLIARKVS